MTELGPGQGQYTLLCQDDGGVIDDLIVYALADRFLLVVNASNIAACRERLEARLPAGVELADRSREVAMLALQGPRWAEALRPLAATPLAFSLDYFEIGEDVIAGVPCLDRADRLHRASPASSSCARGTPRPPSGTGSRAWRRRPRRPGSSPGTHSGSRWATRSTARSSRAGGRRSRPA